MAFTFLRSYQPELEHPEDEEEDIPLEQLRRSGGVRAFSHLPESQADDTQPPPPSRSLERDLSYDEQPPPPSRSLGRDPGFVFNPQGQHSNHDPDPGSEDDDHDPAPNSGTQSPVDGRNATRDPASGAAMPGSAPDGTKMADWPTSRLFEQRLPPGFRTTGTGQLQNLADNAKIDDQVYRFKGSPADVSKHLQEQPLADKPGVTPQPQRRSTTPPTQSGRSGAPGVSSTPAPAQRPGAGPAQSTPPAQQPQAAGAVPQQPAANGSQPLPQLTDLEKKELLTDETPPRPRKPVGQLGITASSSILDPVSTVSGHKPKTVCLYDGSEKRKKNATNNRADAYALQQAAGVYASDGSYMIDISKPGWQQKLKRIQRAQESNGEYIDRIMIFDHGGSASQEFGDQTKGKLDPNSPDWQVITSSVRPRGHIVLPGCSVADTDWNNWNPVTNKAGRYISADGPEFLKDLYIHADTSRKPTIHAYDEAVRHREGKLQHSVTAGREHSYGVEGCKIE